MFNTKIISLLTSLLLSATVLSAAPVEDFPNLGKTLVGEWRADAWGGRLIEAWQQLDATTFHATTAYLEGRDTMYTSTARIEKVGEDWIMFFRVANNPPKIFRAVSADATSILFENPEYSNPRQVRYDFPDGGYQFQRTISGEADGTASSSTFNFEAVPQIEAPTRDGTPELRTAFSPLVGKTWRAEGKWWSGVEFRQEVRFDWNLERNLVVAATNGFTNPETQTWGRRNFGIRKWDKAAEAFVFTEHNVNGEQTDGTLRLRDGNIYYHYDYNGIQMTDLWEKVDASTYNFKIGIYENGEWKKEFLSTQFVDVNTTEPALMKTNPNLPYRQIPDAPEKYDATTVAARMIDGLGFRYYWATEGLRQQDLDYRTTPDARSSAETLDHIYGLARVVRNAVMEEPTLSGGPADEALSFADKRTRTLNLLAEASAHLKQSKAKDIKRFNMIFQRGENQSVFPFWNVLNGPLADATWHVGQIVAFRRASGNPFNNKVSVLRGAVRE